VLTLEQNPNPVDIGEELSAHMELSATAPNPTGTVTLAGYTDSACTILDTNLPPYTTPLIDGAIPDPPPIIYSESGIVYGQATYSGDANNEAVSTSCSAVSVALGLDLSLAVSPSAPILVNQSVSAQASWPVAETPVGTVIYTLFSGGDCTGTTVFGPESVTIASNSAPPSTSVQISEAGDYSWYAEYSGGGVYNPESLCQAFIVKATPSLSIESIPPAPVIGQDLIGRARLSADAYFPTGTVTYEVYLDSDCTVLFTGVEPQTKPLVDNQVPDSDPIPIIYSGTFYGHADYSGDAYNQPASSACLQAISVPGPLTASIVSASLSPVIYSNEANTSSGQIVIMVNDRRGTLAGWSVTLSSSDFLYSGESTAGSGLPNNLLAITSASQPTGVTGQPIGTGGPYANPGAPGNFGTTRTVVTADSGYGSGSYQQVLDISLSIPPYTQVGTYTATLIVATVAAP
jgi:hypothetical protein